MLGEIKKIFSATIIGTVFSFLFLIFASYFISKETLGLYQSFVSFVILFSSVSTLRLELALPVLEVKDRRLLVNWILLLVFLSSIISMFVIDEYLFILGGFFYSLYLAFEMLLTSEGKINRLAIAKVTNSVAFLLLLILIVPVKEITQYDLYISYVLSLFFAVFAFKSNVNSVKLRKPEFSKKLLLKIRPFIIYTFPQNFVNNFGAQLPVVYFSFSGSFALLGVYYISSKVLDVSLGVVSKSINQVFYYFSSKSHKSESVEDIRNSFDKVVVTLAIGSFALYLTSFLINDFLSSYRDYLSDDFFKVMTICLLILPWKLSKMVTSSVATTFIVIGKQHIALIITVIFIPIRGLGLFLGTTPEEKLFYFSISSFCYYVVYLLICRIMMVYNNDL